MKTLAKQYKLIKEGKGHKGVFLKEAKAKFPNLLKNNSTFKEATTILKQKNIISENFVGMPMVGNPIERKKESYETAFAKFLAEAEAKAESKTPAKNVKETDDHNYNYKDKKDPNNMIFGQIQMGYYYEMKQEKNADKTIDEIKDIVFKNLAKDPIYYTKNGQFGEDIGYTDDNVSLGEPKEPKGKYKSSGYGNLKENKILKEARQMSKIELVQDQIRQLKSAISSAEMMAYFGQQGSDQFSSHRDDMDSPWVKGMEKEIEELEQTLIKLKKDPANKEKTVLVKPDGTVEPIKKPVNEIAIAGGLVTGGGFSSKDYKSFFGLEEETDIFSDKARKNAEAIADKSAEIKKNLNLPENESKEEKYFEALTNAAEKLKEEENLSVDKIISMLENHLNLRYRDQED